jgi:hypothetical protein
MRVVEQSLSIKKLYNTTSGRNFLEMENNDGKGKHGIRQG